MEEEAALASRSCGNCFPDEWVSELWPGWPQGARLVECPDMRRLLPLTLADLASSHVDFGLLLFPTHPERPGWNILEHMCSLETLTRQNSTCPGPRLSPKIALMFSIPLRRGHDVSGGTECEAPNKDLPCFSKNPCMVE